MYSVEQIKAKKKSRKGRAGEGRKQSGKGEGKRKKWEKRIELDCTI